MILTMDAYVVPDCDDRSSVRPIIQRSECFHFAAFLRNVADCSLPRISISSGALRNRRYVYGH